MRFGKPFLAAAMAALGLAGGSPCLAAEAGEEALRDFYCAIPDRFASPLRREVADFCAAFSAEIGARVHVVTDFDPTALEGLPADRAVYVLSLARLDSHGLAGRFAGGLVADWAGGALPVSTEVSHAISDTKISAHRLIAFGRMLRAMIDHPSEN